MINRATHYIYGQTLWIYHHLFQACRLRSLLSMPDCTNLMLIGSQDQTSVLDDSIPCTLALRSAPTSNFLVGQLTVGSAVWDMQQVVHNNAMKFQLALDTYTHRYSMCFQRIMLGHICDLPLNNPCWHMPYSKKICRKTHIESVGSPETWNILGTAYTTVMDIQQQCNQCSLTGK